MANSNDEQTNPVSKTTAEINKGEGLAKQPSQSSKTSKQPLPLVTTIMAGLALASALYASYAAWQVKHTINQEKSALTRSVDNLKQQQSEIQKHFLDNNQLSNQNQTKIQSHLQLLDKNLQAAMVQRFYQKQDWLLLKARYYLELAQINAHWSNEQQTTIALLQQADGLLATLSDQSLFAIRQAIAKDITLLQALPPVDITGILAKLDAVQGLVAELSFKNSIKNDNKNEATQPQAVSSSTWRKKFQESLAALGTLVIIQHHDEDLRPLLSPLHQAILKDSLRIRMQEVQWAVLENNAEVYQLALEQAITEIKRNFDETAETTQVLLKQLEALQQEKLGLTKPQINTALPLLEQVIEAKKAETLTPVTTEEGKNP